MKFLPFFGFLFDFLIYFVIEKNRKRGVVLSTEPADDVAHRH